MKERIKRNFKRNIPLFVNTLIEALGYILFIIALLNKYSILLYCSGLVIVATLFVSFIIPLLKREKILILDWVLMAISFVIFVVLLSLYISVIPDDKLRTTIVEISTSSIGGTLTLTGVALSIKYTRIYKEEDRLEEIKPHLFIIDDIRWGTIAKDQKNESLIPFYLNSLDSSFSINGKNNYIFYSIRVANSDLSLSFVRGIVFNDQYILFKYEHVLLKNSFNTIHFGPLCLTTDNELKELYLFCEDIMQTPYLLKLGFDLKEQSDGAFEVKIMSIYNPEKIL